MEELRYEKELVDGTEVVYDIQYFRTPFVKGMRGSYGEPLTPDEGNELMIHCVSIDGVEWDLEDIEHELYEELEDYITDNKEALCGRLR